MMSISLNCYENPSDRTPLSVGEQRDSMVSCLGPEGFIRRVVLEQDVDHVYQVECDKSVGSHRLFTKIKRGDSSFSSSVLLLSRCLPSTCFFFFSKCDHEEKCPREKVLSKFLHCFFWKLGNLLRHIRT